MKQEPLFFRPFFARFCLVLATCLTLMGCSTLNQRKIAKEAFKPSFFIEAVGAELRSSKIVSVQLPISATVIQIKPVPSVPDFELSSVAIAEGKMGKYLQFQVKGKARLHLMQLCGEYRGRRLVLTVGQKPVGAWRINKIISDGIISTYVEKPDEELPDLVDNINGYLR